jgi:hypothetical protein
VTPPGTIGVLSGSSWHAQFGLALSHLEVPPGSKLICTPSVDVVGNMNTMTRGMRGEWLFILGSDHVFDSNLLLRLLSHQVEVVVPHCLKRTPPYDPVVYSGQNEKDEYVGHTRMPEHGLVPVHAAGSAGMLVRREVLEALDDPVWESHGGLNEDLTFCAKVRDDLGVQIWCDVDARIGHISEVSVWPQWRDGEWFISMHLGNGETMPIRRFVRDDLSLTPTT